jgi:hypothetical protein
MVILYKYADDCQIVGNTPLHLCQVCVTLVVRFKGVDKEYCVIVNSNDKAYAKNHYS